MAEAAQKTTLGFETEVKQLLKLVINSLYSNKEIFLRELISNASDAADKLRYEAVSNKDLYEDDSELKVLIDFDKDKKTITVTDNGIGMSRDEVIANLGTIAKSGTKEFFEKLTGNAKEDAHLIGQFGVGFYSAFIVAKKIIVESRKAGLAAAQGVRWESTGEGDYSIETIEKKDRGTKIILDLKQGEDEFLDTYRLENIIHKYSDHIPIKIMMKKAELDDKGNEKPNPEYQQINRATALWTLAKSQIKADEYKEFYKHIAHDFEEPLLWTHNKVEGKLQFITLLYLPKRAPFDLYNREHPHGLKLYVQRVFIMDNAKELLPNYLRFVKGVVDSSDLPLNISREILQQNRIIDNIKSAVVKRVLSMLDHLSKDEQEKYQAFWKEFGQVLKEGIAEDMTNKDEIAKLLRFATSNKDTNEQDVSLETYVNRMKPGQDKIYYITAESFITAKNSPHLEIFRKKGIEVLLLSDRIDEWLAVHLTEFQGKQLQSITKGDLDLGEVEDKQEKEEQEKITNEFADLAKRVKEILKNEIKDAKVTHRLVDSPACIVYDEQDLGGHMQRLMKAAGQAMPESKPILELNPKHPIVESLNQEQNETRFNEVSHLLLEQSILAEGGQLDDPALFIKRMNHLILELSR
ncbi:MAG: molecular chaperone HtpG [Pseudomonadota bacterium]